MTGLDAMPEPGVDGLDAPEVREAIRREVAGFTAARDDVDEVVADVLAALAPYVAALRLAAWREGVEAAAEVCERRAEMLWKRGSFLEEQCAIFAEGMARDVRTLPTPAEFATPEPSPDARRAAFRHGREIGRDDAVQACQRYAAREREARDEAHERCDDVEEADCTRAVHVAEVIAAYIEQLCPVEDEDEPEEFGTAGVPDARAT